jgi:hypothetical protein
MPYLQMQTACCNLGLSNEITNCTPPPPPQKKIFIFIEPSFDSFRVPRNDLTGMRIIIKDGGGGIKKQFHRRVLFIRFFVG